MMKETNDDANMRKQSEDSSNGILSVGTLQCGVDMGKCANQPVMGKTNTLYQSRKG